MAHSIRARHLGTISPSYTGGSSTVLAAVRVRHAARGGPLAAQKGTARARPGRVPSHRRPLRDRVPRRRRLFPMALAHRQGAVRRSGRGHPAALRRRRRGDRDALRPRRARAGRARSRRRQRGRRARGLGQADAQHVPLRGGRRDRSAPPRAARPCASGRDHLRGAVRSRALLPLRGGRARRGARVFVRRRRRHSHRPARRRRRGCSSLLRTTRHKPIARPAGPKPRRRSSRRWPRGSRPTPPCR